MVTLANLRSQSSRELAQLAKTSGISGWHQMRKEQLVQALLKSIRKRGGDLNGIDHKRAMPTKQTASEKSKPKSNPAKPKRAAIESNNRQASNKPPLKPATRSTAAGKNLSTASKDSAPSAKTQPLQPSVVAAKIMEDNARREQLKDLARSAAAAKENRQITKDRLILIVRDSHWLQVYWEITEATVRRARSALEKNWRGTRPVLRLFELNEEAEGTTENLIREIEVHSGVDTWYIDTPNPTKTYRVAIGYCTAEDRFFPIAKSNKVTTPAAGIPAAQDHWVDIATRFETYFAMSGGFADDNEAKDLQNIFEEKLRRPVKALSTEQARSLDRLADFRFEVDAQVVIYGVTNPGSIVSIDGEPLPVEENGTFSVRVDMPDKRQVFPVVACSRDGSQQRTTVLAIERNTKVMDPIDSEHDEM